MTLSYADAMKKKRPLPGPAAPPERIVEKNHPANNDDQSNGQQTAQPPANRGVWGSKQKNKGASSVASTPQPLASKKSLKDNHHRSHSNPWGKPTPVKNAGKANTTTSVKILSKPPGAVTHQPGVSRNNPSSRSAWKTNGGRNNTKQPAATAIIKSQQPAKGDQQQQQGQKKSKKPKPQLQSMSIADMISPRKPAKGKAKTVQSPSQNNLSLQGATHTPVFSDSKEFPSLGAVSTRTTAPKAWGIKSAPVAPAVGSTSKQPPSKKPMSKKSTQKKDKQKNNATTAPAPVIDARSAALFFRPVEDHRDDGGDEHKLLRLLRDRTVYQKKGRQRLNPRKKKFTALKKKVLQERLRKWRELHPEKSPPDDTVEGEPLQQSEACSICVYNYVQAEELEDDDEYHEIQENLATMAIKIGQVVHVSVPRNLQDREDKYPAFVKFQSPKDAAAAKACWNGLVIGGETLQVSFINESSISDTTAAKWEDKMLLAETNSEGSMNDPAKSTATAAILLREVLTEDDYEDEDCMIESLADVKNLVANYGSLTDIKPGVQNDGSVVLTYAVESKEAQAIAQRLNDTTLSGKHLSSTVLETGLPDLSTNSSSAVVLENVLGKDDLDDEDCMNETLDDIRELAGRHGDISCLEAFGNAVKVFYSGPLSLAQNAADEMNGITLGGTSVLAYVEGTRQATTDTRRMEPSIYLHNVLTVDDLEDDECMQESLDDLRRIASKYGTVSNLEIVSIDGTSIVRVSFGIADLTAAQSAISEFDGMDMGGMIIKATWTSGCSTDNISGSSTGVDPVVTPLETGKSKRSPAEDDNVIAKKARTDEVEPLYSGDKLVPERFAQAKRVPKIPNPAGPREYAKQTNDESVRPLLTEMLGELMRLQKRAVEEKNTKAKRRLVMGLREVARGIRSHKVKMIVMANNLDQYGAIDEKLQEIIDLAQNEGVPLFFEFTKRSLGKAIGKSIKIAVIGIQNAEGAHQPFKKLTARAAQV